MKNTKEGSLTVEAALVLPIFLFSVLFFLYFFPFLFLQDSIQSAITGAGRFLSRYEELLEQTDGLEGTGQILVKQRFFDYLDEKNMNENCIVGGKAGIWVSLEEDPDEDIIDITAVYRVRFPIPFFGEKISLIKQRVRTRAFVGKNLKRQSGNKEDDRWEPEEEEMVYVTENGSVYHKNENCTHLKLSISEVSPGQLEIVRNENGGKYKPCEKCMNQTEEMGIFYIAKEGDRYHSKLSCSGLKRTVYEVCYSEVKDWQKCKRCG